MPTTPRTASSSSTSIAVTTSTHHWLRQQHLRWSIPPHIRLTPIAMQSIHISTLRKILDSPDPIDIRLCTRSGEIQSWHRCISLKYDFYKDGASWRQNIKQRLNVILRRSPPYQKTQDEWSCWTLTKSGSFEMFVYLRWMGWRCICSVSQEVSFFVIKSTFVFAWLILYICGFIEYVSGIF